MPTKSACRSGAEGFELPAPGLLLAVKVNDDLLYNRITSELKKSQAVELTDEKGLKMCAMPIPIPLPVELKITVATSGDYFFLATSPTLVREALAVRWQTTGLRQDAEFAALLKHLPAAGNQFVYADKRFSGMIPEVQKQVLAMQQKDIKPEQMEFIQKLFMSQADLRAFRLAHTATGWQSVSWAIKIPPPRSWPRPPSASRPSGRRWFCPRSPRPKRGRKPSIASTT